MYVRSKRGPHLLLVSSIGMTTPGYDLDRYRRPPRRSDVLREGSAMGGLVGPILARAGGYAFDTWTVEQGTSPGYVYRRLEDAHHARKTIIDRASCEQEMPGDLYPLAALCVCDTLEHFRSRQPMSRLARIPPRTGSVFRSSGRPTLRLASTPAASR